MWCSLLRPVLLCLPGAPFLFGCRLVLLSLCALCWVFPSSVCVSVGPCVLPLLPLLCLLSPALTQAQMNGELFDCTNFCFLDDFLFGRFLH